MRILHTEASQGWGGQEIRIINESKIFSEKGHTVAIATNPNSPLAKNAKKAGLSVIEINLTKKNISNLLSLRLAIKNFSPDVISCHSSTDHWLSALARIFLKNSPKIVRTRHISAKVTRNFPTKWLYNYGSDHIMTTGKAIREALIHDSFVNGKNISSVPTGINEKLFAPGDKKIARKTTQLPKEKIIIGIIATLRSWKGHSYLIEAFSKINNQNTILVIVGNGPQAIALNNQIKQLNLEGKVILTGNQSNVLPYLQSFDIFAFPSYANEGVPQSLLQAMAVGLPIVSCPIGGIPEATENYSKIIFCEPKNSTELAQCLNNLINGDIKQAESHIPFSIDSLYNESFKVYKSCLSKSDKAE